MTVHEVEDVLRKLGTSASGIPTRADTRPTHLFVVHCGTKSVLEERLELVLALVLEQGGDTGDKGRGDAIGAIVELVVVVVKRSVLACDRSELCTGVREAGLSLLMVVVEGARV